MENWDNTNLPENHEFMPNVEFTAVINGTWKRKKNDGTEEVAQKWDYISKADETGASLQVGVYSATDHEEVKMNTPYDIIVKRAVGKDGTFYGYTLKGFGLAGKPIPKKEPTSRFQKGLKLNAKAEALKASVVLFTGTGGNNVSDVLDVAEVFEAYINGEYKAETKTANENPITKSKK